MLFIPFLYKSIINLNENYVLIIPAGSFTWILCYIIFSWWICWNEISDFFLNVQNNELFWKVICFWLRGGWVGSELRLWPAEALNRHEYCWVEASSNTSLDFNVCTLPLNEKISWPLCHKFWSFLHILILMVMNTSIASKSPLPRNTNRIFVVLFLFWAFFVVGVFLFFTFNGRWQNELRDENNSPL